MMTGHSKLLVWYQCVSPVNGLTIFPRCSLPYTYNPDQEQVKDNRSLNPHYSYSFHIIQFLDVTL